MPHVRTADLLAVVAAGEVVRLPTMLPPIAAGPAEDGSPDAARWQHPCGNLR